MHCVQKIELHQAYNIVHVPYHDRFVVGIQVAPAWRYLGVRGFTWVVAT